MPNSNSLPPSTTLLLRGSPLVLLVDDEDLLREAWTFQIETLGGRVITAVDGQDGVEVFEKYMGEIDVVFMDFSMPRMNGYEAYREMRKLSPDIPIVMVSGLVITPQVERLRARGEIAWLSKPFGVVEICEVINRVVK